MDRGRIVREALAVLLADLDAEGDKSLVARRLWKRQGRTDGRAQEPDGGGQRSRMDSGARSSPQ